MSFIFIQENALENVVWRMAAILSRTQCVNKNMTLSKLTSVNRHLSGGNTFPTMLNVISVRADEAGAARYCRAIFVRTRKVPTCPFQNANASPSSARQGWRKYFVISVFSDSSVAACAGAVDLSTKLNSLFGFLGGELVHGCLLWKGYINHCTCLGR